MTIKAITEVSGLKMEQEVVTYKQNTPDGKFQIVNQPGPVQEPGDLADPRASPRTTASSTWIKNSRLGKMTDVRKGGAIMVYDYEGNAIKRYKLTNVWPKSLEIGSLKAGDTSYLSEKLVLTCEGIEVELMRRGTLTFPDRDTVAREQAHAPSSAAAPGSPSGSAAQQGEPADGVRVRAAPRLRRRRRHGAPRRRDAPGDRPRRAGPAARRPRPGEPGLPHRRPARPRDHPDRARSPTCTPASSRSCSRPTSRSCRTSTDGSTPRATPARPSPARRATTPSPSTSRVGAWGNRDVRSRAPLRRGRVRRLLPALVPGRDPRPRARRARSATSPRSPRSTRASPRTETTWPAGGRR